MDKLTTLVSSIRFKYSLVESSKVVVVDSLFIVAPIVCGGSVFSPSFVMQYFMIFLVSQSS